MAPPLVRTPNASMEKDEVYPKPSMPSEIPPVTESVKGIEILRLSVKVRPRGHQPIASWWAEGGLHPRQEPLMMNGSATHPADVCRLCGPVFDARSTTFSLVICLARTARLASGVTERAVIWLGARLTNLSGSAATLRRHASRKAIRVKYRILAGFELVRMFRTRDVVEVLGDDGGRGNSLPGYSSLRSSTRALRFSRLPRRY